MIKRYARRFISACLTMLFISLPVSADSTADHSKYKELDRQFRSGPEVTKACISCHTEAAKQIHKTKHWKWEFINPENGQRLGKKNVLNNYCITPQSNLAACTGCHVGFGWKDDSFDFTSEENVDCLVCHDTTGNYSKPPGKGGHPADYVNLKNVAQNIGKTSRDSCGSCHFFGGGGDGVKHGDLDSSLAAPERELDVHMDALGADFTCSTCHRGSNHDVVGSRYTPMAADTRGYLIRGKHDEENTATCRSCHGHHPHLSDHKILNNHTDKIACQTCHIPSFARGGVATKMTWDWSTAGRLTPDGKPLEIKDEKGHVIYSSKKGDFSYGINVIPEYIWFNGKVNYTLLSDKIDKQTGITHINTFGGSPDDGISRIWPAKDFQGMQPYDPINKTLVVPHTTGKDETSYWTNFDWNKAVTQGMKVAGLPFSGQVDFIKTKMSWPITHMVAPAEDALRCEDCHSKNSRLRDIGGIYIPGRDRTVWLDNIGWALTILSLIAIAIHGSIRVFTYYRRNL